MQWKTVRLLSFSVRFSKTKQGDCTGTVPSGVKRNGTCVQSVSLLASRDCRGTWFLKRPGQFLKHASLLVCAKTQFLVEPTPFQQPHTHKFCSHKPFIPLSHFQVSDIFPNHQRAQKGKALVYLCFSAFYLRPHLRCNTLCRVLAVPGEAGCTQCAAYRTVSFPVAKSQSG